MLRKLPVVPANNRNEEGQFESDHGVSDQDVLKAMEHLEPYTTGELAEMLDIPRRTAYNYLQTLYEDDRISKKKQEERRVIWIRGK